jgi:ABC-type thiamine transport system ATPase subunit
MPKTTVTLSTPVVASPRVLQLSGMFDLPPAGRQEQTWDVDLPLEGWDWHVGLIVGPSGCGKSTVARHLFAEALRDEHSYAWPADRAALDAFPAELPIRDIVELLSAVGFSSPPAWLRPFDRLSTGERFRVTLARMLAEAGPLVVCDEFTSVVDRTVAQVGSAAVARAVRRRGQRFIAVTCHEDVEEWLQPDWTFRPATGTFARRSLQRRPAVALAIVRCTRAAWPLFRHHHYLNHALHPAAACFLALWRGRPVAFSAWLPAPGRGRTGPARREHRTVCLPDYQGVGIGAALAAFCASVFKAHGYRAVSTTAHPGVIAHRCRSPLWRLIRQPGLGRGGRGGRWRHHVTRATAGFEYFGPAADPAAARLLEA